MSEIERAIAHIERMQAHGMEVVDGGMFEQKMLDNIAESIVMIEIALTALREKAEQERGCGACVDNGAYLNCGFQRQISEYEFEMRGITPNFCPNCGRKLDDSLQQLDDGSTNGRDAYDKLAEEFDKVFNVKIRNKYGQ